MIAFKPMLAVDATDDLSKLRYPLLASPKLDGIRCVVRGGKALSRSLKPIPNPALRRLLERPELEGLDGELMIPGASFQETTSAVMGRSVPDEISARVVYHVFDATDHVADAPFWGRLHDVQQQVGRLGDPRVHYVAHYQVDDVAALERYEALILFEGHEGVMLRDPNGPYKCGRSTLKEGYLLKVKRFADAEAVVVGFEERQHNGNEAFVSELGRTKRSSAQAGKSGMGTLGAFLLRCEDFPCVKCQGGPDHDSCLDCEHTGLQLFTCGTGLDDAQRGDFWRRQDELCGKLVKFKYQAFGSLNAPRSPVFLGLRDERDL